MADRIGHAFPKRSNDYRMLYVWRSWPSMETISFGKRQQTDVGVRPSVFHRAGSVTAPSLRRQPTATHLRARIDGRLCDCLLDSGADVCLIPSSWIQPDRLRPTQRSVTAVNDTQVILHGEIDLIVTLENLKIPTSFIASPNIDEVILSKD